MNTLEDVVKHCRAAVHLTINDHTTGYQSVADYVIEISGRDNDYFSDVSPEEKQEMIAANTVVELQFYPRTPIGFYRIYGSTIQSVVDKAMSILLSTETA